MIYLGIDVSKAKIDCCILIENRFLHHIFKNDSEGFQKLSAWLDKYQVNKVWACLETTGIYSDAISEYLYNCGHDVSLCNPLAIKSFSNANLQSTKTDKQDAKTILLFCKALKPSLYTPPTEQEKELKSLTRQLEHYKIMLVQQTNRLQVITISAQHLTKQTIEHLKQQIETTQNMIDAHIKADEQLKKKADLLKSVSAIGDRTVPILLTMFAEKKFKTANQVISYVGLNPIIKQSGNHKASYPRISKQGDRHIRTALYMPALVAYSMKEFKPFVERLKEAGKKPKQIIVALMRKLLVYCYTVLKTEQKYVKNFSAIV